MMLSKFLVILGAVSTAGAAGVITSKDVVDSSAEAHEVSLTDADFEASPEIDLKTIGIAVQDDPTMGSKQEGDIALPSVKEFVESNNKLGRNAIRQPYRRWPNNEIPYTMSSQYGSYAKSVIAKAMKEYHDKTCIRFIPRDASRHPDYLYIHPDDGCYSLVGKTGGRQPLSLDAGCIQVGTIVHELMHAVGFFHEQSRSDRDQFIDIQWRNVMNGADDQFEKYNLNVIDHLNEAYDYSSIMHYGPYAFSGSGQKTITPKRAGAERMGQRVAFSQTDLRKINKLYNCAASTGGSGPMITGNGIDNRQFPFTNFFPFIPTDAPVVTTENPFVVQRECKDDNWRCTFWALLGHCETYAEIRDEACRRSCVTCIGGLSGGGALGIVDEMSISSVKKKKLKRKLDARGNS